MEFHSLHLPNFWGSALVNGDYSGLEEEDIKELNSNVVLCFNMIHISPWNSTVGLFEGAHKILNGDEFLMLYGPFKENDEHISESNHHFDLNLRSQNSAWGVRNLQTVIQLALRYQFCLEVKQPMPANNLSVLFRRMSA